MYGTLMPNTINWLLLTSYSCVVLSRNQFFFARPHLIMVTTALQRCKIMNQGFPQVEHKTESENTHAHIIKKMGSITKIITCAIDAIAGITLLAKAIK